MSRDAHIPWSCARAAVILVLAVARPAHAQLISPGKLTRAHSSLEGVTNCTSCHKLGEKGASAPACLNCHRPLARRIREGRGYHAGVSENNCADCHREHLGEGFAMVRLDTSRFDHSQTGYQLLESHLTASCRSCHSADYIADPEVREAKTRNGALGRTFLGVSTVCGTCHLKDSPHRNQFSTQDCSTCHRETDWKRAERFDHATAKFRLTGRHVSVACVSCHARASKTDVGSLVYRGLEFRDCSSCHRDPHRGTMGAAPVCASCHSDTGWQRVSRDRLAEKFSHDRTGFSLVGSHERLQCSACHASPAPNTPTIKMRLKRGTERQSFPSPIAESCVSCHRDYHEGQLEDSPGGTQCSNCHSEGAWQPVAYTIARHNRESAFPLQGAHQATPCIDCHRPAQSQQPLVFKFSDLSCVSCHEKDNTHADRFAGPEGRTVCSSCHSTASWKVGAGFDHAVTGFPLTGAHRESACEACHGGSATSPAAQDAPELSTECSSCHAKDDPHHAQFDPNACQTCHDTASFRISRFDHSISKFSLAGAHENVPCAACHRIESDSGGRPFVRFKPLGTDCESCHVRSSP